LALDFELVGYVVLFYITLLALHIVKKRFSPPMYLHPKARIFAGDGKVFLPKIIRLLSWSVMFVLTLAVFEPALTKEETQISSEGAALYLVIDQSGSMDRPSEMQRSKRKIDDVRSVVSAFVRKRPNDLIGLISFARRAPIVVPLTLDHNFVLAAIEKLDVVKRAEDEGSAIGYAVYKTAHLFAETKLFFETKKEAPYRIQSAAIVLFTDGFPHPSPLDRKDSLRHTSLSKAALFAKEKAVRIYVVNVDPKVVQKRFQSQLLELKNLADVTEGKIYFAQKEGDLEAIVDEIDTLEKTKIVTKRQHSIAPNFVLASFGMLIFVLFLELCILRRVP